MAFRLVPIFHGRISADGHLSLHQAERVQRQGYLRRLAEHGPVDVDVIVRKHRNRRTDKQNRWHWGIALPLIAHELGYDRHEHERLHYGLLDKCFGMRYDEKLQQHVPNVIHSADLTTEQFSELMEWEVRWAASELGISIPLPGEAEAA